MSASEIQSKLALPYTPPYIANVTEVPAGTTLLGGVANDLFGQGGGGMQYLITSGRVTFGNAAPL
jgi:hypothetical protein